MGKLGHSSSNVGMVYTKLFWNESRKTHSVEIKSEQMVYIITASNVQLWNMLKI